MYGETMIVAARGGMGVAVLPCFVGNAGPLLARVPGSDINQHGTLWLLTQSEAQRTKRVRLFTEFLPRRLTAHEALLAGAAVSATG